MLPIICGKMNRNLTLGFVADNCQSCNRIAPMRLLRDAVIEHLYFIPSGDGETLGYKVKCENCGFEREAMPLDYSDVVNKQQTPLPDLIARTNPSVNGDSIAHASRINRWRSLAGPWLSVNTILRERSLKGTHLDARANLAILSFPLSFVGTWWLCEEVMFFDAYRLQTMLLAGAVTFVWMCKESGKEVSRYFSKVLLAPLAAELHRINAQPWEIKELFTRSKRLRYKIEQVTEADDIINSIESARLRPVAPRVLAQA